MKKEREGRVEIEEMKEDPELNMEFEGASDLFR
jgi:hypothetical protein